MTFIRRMRNVHAGGNAERTQVAVEYNGPVVRTPGENMQSFYSCPLVIGLLYDLEKSLRVFLGWAWSRYLLRAFEKEL